jgi:mono/diheme cytochrome c family protein
VILGSLLVALAACKGSGPSTPRNEEEDLFHNVCARCHGADGTGGPPDPLGNPGPKNFTDPVFQRSMTDEQLRNAIENGNRGMPAFGAALTPAQVSLMIAHVRKLDSSLKHGPAPSASARATAAPSSTP